MKYRVVRINGKYALERVVTFLGFGYATGKYLDLAAPGFSWCVGDRFFRDCLTTDKSKVIALCDEYNAKPEQVYP